MSGPPAPAAGEALVARVDFGACTLLLDDGGWLDATVRGRLMGEKKALGNAVVVGDRVRFEPLKGEAGGGEAAEGEDTGAPGAARARRGRAVVVEVLPRRNAFSRRASGRDAVEQVVAANLDQVVIVTSIREPEFKPGLVDRMLAQAEHAGIPARLVINKTDLDTAHEAAEILADYGRAGYAGHAVSAASRSGLEALHQAMRGRRSLFAGHSGVGKSTLLNALEPDFELLSGRVNPKTGKGRHTTTAAWLLRPEPDVELIDTPGVRVFALWGVGAADLDRAYAEFRPHLGGCKFRDCLHGNEPGCAVRAAVDRGGIAARRYASYHKLREELAQERQLQTMREQRRC